MQLDRLLRVVVVVGSSFCGPLNLVLELGAVLSDFGDDLTLENKQPGSCS